MTFKEELVLHPLFPKHPYVMHEGESIDLKRRVELFGYEAIGKQNWNIQESREVRLDFQCNDGSKGYMYFYLDKERNPNQLNNPNLIFGSKLLQ